MINNIQESEVEASTAVPDSFDITFQWLTREHGADWETWRSYMEAFIQTVHEGRQLALGSVRVFAKRYLTNVALALPREPEWLLSRANAAPDYYSVAYPKGNTGSVKANNQVSRFLNWVLETHFSEPDDHGRPTVPPQFHNSIGHLQEGGNIIPKETVRTPLPYIYLQRLRKILGPGAHFRDWIWAQNVIGIELDANGKSTTKSKQLGDWFEVEPIVVDPADPDCVSRKRRIAERRDQVTGNVQRDITVTEMWSPVRAVALLLKLHLPLRTFQVRMLDSGEADTWRYQTAGRGGPTREDPAPGELPPVDWMTNLGPLADGDERCPVQRGVFRRIQDHEHKRLITGFYINTNKTKDQKTNAEYESKGYVIPWQYEEVLYWLEKLRDWQEKYNPIDAAVSWQTLSHKHIGAIKSPKVLARHADSCFLFRDASTKGANRGKPLVDGSLDRVWYGLLATLETEEANKGQKYNDGTRIRFVEPICNANNGTTTLFPLHSLRVSLLTCLALDGDLPLPILSKLVAGHSRLIMTLYYMKVGPGRLAEEIAKARTRMAEAAPESLRHFLCNASLEQLAERLTAVDWSSVRAVLGEMPEQRVAAGWTLMPYGWCLTGGNAGGGEGNAKVSGCHNGGALIHGNKNKPSDCAYTPVHGGARNCTCCRWLISGPQFLTQLDIRFNQVSFWMSEATQDVMAVEAQRDALQDVRHRTYAAGQQSIHESEYLTLEQRVEKGWARVDEHGITLAHTYRLIMRCLALIETGVVGKQQLVAVGDAATVQAVFQETNSRLLQINRICIDAEILPDNDIGKALFIRGQMLDSALMRDGFQPVMLNLSEDQQLKLGNRLVDELGYRYSPANPQAGLATVIRSIEAGQSLAELGLTAAVTEAIEALTRRPALRLGDKPLFFRPHRHNSSRTLRETL